VGAESRIEDTGSAWWVNFHQGAFYVEVVLSPSTGPAPDYAPGNPATKAEAIRFAQAVASAIGAGPVLPGTGGSGGGGGSVKVNLPLVNFGTVDVGSVSLPQTVTVTVTGSATSLDPAVSGAGFSISASTCAALQPAGTCTITLVFSPAAVGVASGVLTVGTVQVALSGSGAPPVSFAVSPDRIDLGTLLAGSTAPATVTIAPTGMLTSLACLASGVDLTLTSQTCPSSGPVSTACTYTFTFRAASSGQKSDAIVCTGGGKTTQTNVTATVVSPGALAISPATGAFSAAVGQSTMVTFYLANTGGALTGILAIAVTGAGFAVTSNDCVVPLAPLSTCKIQVTFAPSAAGTVAGALTVTDATPGSTPATASLSGVGVVQ
jgi:hypothetical protein